MFKRLISSGLLIGLSLAATATVAAPKSVEEFLARDDFEQLALSTDGKHLAATVPLGDRTAMVMIRLSDMQRVGAVQHGRDQHVYDVHWVGPDRLIYSLGEKAADSDILETRGELFAVNADGSGVDLLIGERAGVDRISASNIRARQPELVFARLIDTLRTDPDTVLISTYKRDGSQAAFTKVERMNVRNGKRVVVAQAPVRRADFVVDHAGKVRFARGEDVDNLSRLYYRAGEKDEWALINDEARSGLAVSAIGFSADNRTAYLWSQQAEGPDAIFAFDVESHQQTLLLRDDNSDPFDVLYSPKDGAPYGVIYMDGLPRAEYFDAKGEAARLHRSLQSSFGSQVVMLGRLSDGQQTGLLVVSGDRNPGDFYLFDHANKKAAFLLARNARLDPEELANVKPVNLAARDGLALHGYLTLPPGSDGKNLPMIVNPHGGPYNEADTWSFDPTVQLLASRGYAVLQINFRGSGNHGRSFVRAGYRQWGATMQDDLTDATRWAVEQGIGDPARVCIYGASYGGYAALMGAAKEPNLYRCAVGHVGVYDLKLMHGEGDIASKRWGRNYLRDILGRDNLELVSPNRLADRIAAPVMLTAGGADERAPAIHTELMRKALSALGKPVEMKIYPGEGHGFTVHENSVDFHTRLLDFLARYNPTSVNAVVQ